MIAFFCCAEQLSLIFFQLKSCIVLDSSPSFNTVSWCHPTVSLRKGGGSVLEGLSAALIVLLTVNRMSILAVWPSSVKAVTDGSLVSADHLPSTAAAAAPSITHPTSILLPLAANSCCSIVSFTLSATKLAERQDDGRGEIEGRSSNISSMLHWSNEPWQPDIPALALIKVSWRVGARLALSVAQEHVHLSPGCTWEGKEMLGER